MSSLRESYDRWRKGEKAFSEAFSAIIILPIVVASIFVLIEIGFYMRYRIAVDDVVHDTVRAISADGTAGLPPRWSNLFPAVGSPTNQDRWIYVSRERLRELCGSTNQRCTSPPQMFCTPTGSVAANPGVVVRCTATFPYRNILNFTVNNRTLNLGFPAFWSEPIIFTAQSQTMVGRGA